MPEFDWGSAPRPAPNTFDWSTAPRPTPTPTPEIDFSTAPRPRPIRPTVNINPPGLKDMVPAPVKSYGQRLYDTAGDVYNTGVAIGGSVLAAGQDALGAFNKWGSTPKFPAQEEAVINTVGKLGPTAKAAAEFGVRGVTAPMKGGPISKAIDLAAGKVAGAAEWAVTPKYPDVEQDMIEGMTEAVRPGDSFGRPLTEKAIRFGMEGSTAPIGVIPVGGAIAGRMAYKAAPKVISKVANLFGKAKAVPKIHGPLTMEDAFLDEVANAKSLAGEQIGLYAKEKSRRVKEMLKVNALGKGPQGFSEQKSALGGPLPQVPFQSIESKFTPENITTLYDKIEKSKLSPLDKISAKSGLEKLMGGVVAGVPERSELILLRKIWPELKTPQLKDGLITSIGGISRTFMSGGDITSFPLRQGGTLVSRPQFWKSIPKGISSGLDEATYNTTMKDIKSSKFYDLGHDYGKLDITDLNDVQEESFANAWANSLPGIKHSARAFSATANMQRQGLFDEIIEKGAKLGKVIDPTDEKFDAKFVQEVGEYVNAATGRGHLGFFERYARPLNATIYSPRFAASRLGLMRRVLIDPLKAPANVVRGAVGKTPYERIDPLVRKEAWRDFFAFAGMQGAILSAAKIAQAAGNEVEVGAEPTSTDWGKIKSGNARLDFNAGMQPYLRAAAQLAEKAQTSSISGKRTNLEEGYKPETSLDVLQKLIMSKEAPLAAFVTNFLQGEDLAGQPVTLSSEMRNKLSPIILQDIIELLKEDPSLLPLIVPANFGAGLQVYGAGDIKKQQKKGELSVTIPKIKQPSFKF